MATGKGSQRSGMGMSVSPNRAKRRAKGRRAQEARWAAMAGPVVVVQEPMAMCQLEDCDGTCGDWHPL